MKTALPPPPSFSAPQRPSSVQGLGAELSTLGPKMRGAPRETVLSFL